MIKFAAMCFLKPEYFEWFVMPECNNRASISLVFPGFLLKTCPEKGAGWE